MNKYYITSIRQFLHPALEIVVILKNSHGISVTLNVRDVEKNQVLMAALSNDDVERIKQYSSFINKEPIR